MSINREVILNSSSATRKVVWPVKATEEVVDIAVIIKILKYLSKVKEASISDIVKNAHVSYSTTRTCIPLLVSQGLVEVRREGKKKVVSITRKGYDFLLAVARVYAFLGIPFD